VVDAPSNKPLFSYVSLMSSLLDGEILSAESLKQMTSFFPQNKREIELGLGLERIVTPYGSIIPS
jgi:hypothetical protein